MTSISAIFRKIYSKASCDGKISVLSLGAKVTSIVICLCFITPVFIAEGTIYIQLEVRAIQIYDSTPVNAL